jgi:hypothetical protein
MPVRDRAGEVVREERGDVVPGRVNGEAVSTGVALPSEPGRVLLVDEGEPAAVAVRAAEHAGHGVQLEGRQVRRRRESALAELSCPEPRDAAGSIEEDPAREGWAEGLVDPPVVAVLAQHVHDLPGLHDEVGQHGVLDA